MCTDQRQDGRELPVVVVSMGGAFSPESGMAAIDNAVAELAPPDNHLIRGRNWAPGLRGQRIVTTNDTSKIWNTIRELSRIGDNSKALLVAGKSSGGVMAWNTFRLYYLQIARCYDRCALVLVDPHGAVTGDGRVGPYCDMQSLWWPGNWPANQRILRVYNIYQQLHPAVLPNVEDLSMLANRTAETLTGARFDSGLVIQEQLSDGQGLHHMNIVSHSRTRRIIQMAFRFAHRGL